MKLIKPSFKILTHQFDLNSIYQHIETAARTCYKSEKKEGVNAKDFVDKLIKMKHLSMLEHGTIYLLFSECNKDDVNFIKKYEDNPYSVVKCIGYDDDIIDTEEDELGEYNVYRGERLGVGVYGNRVYAITTNLRVLYENNWLDDVKYLCCPTKYHEKRYTVKFITSIGIVRELLRHRKFSFANESTRFCNYSSEKKFGGEITYIIPSWCNDIPDNLHLEDRLDAKKFVWKVDSIFKEVEQKGAVSKGVSKFTQRFIYGCLNTEEVYIGLIAAGYKPQQAREVLPLATKSELIMTGFESDWKDLFNKRSSTALTGKPHPDMINLIDPLKKEFIKYENKLK